MIETPGLGYLLAHPGALSLVAERPAWLLLTLAALWLAWRQRPDAGAALAFRAVALGALGLALAGLAIRAALPSDRVAVVALVDRSDSIDTAGRAWQELYVNRLADSLAPEDQLTVVNFASEAVAAADGNVGGVPGSSGVTDIARAIDAGLALLPADRERRLVLLSDGNETRGDARARLSVLRGGRVVLHAATPPRAAGGDVVLDRIAAPSSVAEDTVFPIRVVVRNHGEAQEARLALGVDGARVGIEKVTLRPGLNSLELPYRLNHAGNHRVRVEIEPGRDARRGNNAREATVLVSGRVRVLVVSPDGKSPLATVLERKGAEATTVRPADVGPRLAGLANYHGLLFEDVTADSLPPRALESVEQYVRDGGAFVWAAGEKAWGDPGYRSSPLARLLPLTLEPRRPPRASREPLALFLLIDRSNSMGYHVHNRLERSSTQSKLEYAKRAALAVVEQLRDTDLVGVLVFDARMFEVAPLRPLREGRAALRRDIPRLVPGGGTDFFDALESARRQLVEARAGLAHIMLLTDGDTNRAAAEHESLVEGVARAGISVTTIRIGDDTVNLQFLNDISRRTGGQFHHVADAEQLPELMLGDATRALGHSPRTAPTYVPRLSAPSQVLAGVRAETLPDISGYAFARPRPGADVLLHVAAQDRKDPLLAVWQYGLGRVVALTASPEEDARRWVAWDGFGKFWSQVVRWASRDQAGSDLLLDVQPSATGWTLVVRAGRDAGEAALSARLGDTELELAPTGPREYAAPLPAGLAPGPYPVTLLLRRAGTGAEQRTLQMTIPAGDTVSPDEFASAAPNEALLRALSEGTSGTLDAPIDKVVARPTGERYADRRLDGLLLPLAMVAFLLDVAARRYRAGLRP